MSKSASAVLNFFSRASSSSSSAPAGSFGARLRLSPPSSLLGDAGGDMSMPSTRTSPTTSAMSASSFPRDFLADFGAGDSKPGFFLIGTSAADPGTDGGAGDRSPSSTASAHDDDPNVADSITRKHRKSRANALDAAAARFESSSSDSTSTPPSASIDSSSSSAASSGPRENTAAPNR